jgi:hypothetical protein
MEIERAPTRSMNRAGQPGQRDPWRQIVAQLVTYSALVPNGICEVRAMAEESMCVFSPRTRVCDGASQRPRTRPGLFKKVHPLKSNKIQLTADGSVIGLQRWNITRGKPSGLYSRYLGSSLHHKVLVQKFAFCQHHKCVTAYAKFLSWYGGAKQKYYNNTRQGYEILLDTGVSAFTRPHH